jgi:hypothetical protein
LSAPGVENRSRTRKALLAATPPAVGTSSWVTGTALPDAAATWRADTDTAAALAGVAVMPCATTPLVL